MMFTINWVDDSSKMERRKRDRVESASFAKQFRDIVVAGGINAQHAAVEVGLEQLLKLIVRIEAPEEDGAKKGNPKENA